VHQPHAAAQPLAGNDRREFFGGIALGFERAAIPLRHAASIVAPARGESPGSHFGEFL
jgi:hypothetical protein